MRYRYQSSGMVSEIMLERVGDEYRAIVGGETHHLRILSAAAGELNLLFNGRPIRIYYAEDGAKKWLSLDGCAYLLEPPAHAGALLSAAQGAEAVVRSPMPAQVRAVLVAEGDSVQKGQTLMLLEAMKMEIHLAAPRAGVVGKVAVEAGKTVQKDQILAEIGGSVE